MWRVPDEDDIAATISLREKESFSPMAARRSMVMNGETV